MKNLLQIICGLLLLSSCAKRPVVITVQSHIDSCEGTKVSIIDANNRRVLDSTIVKNGKFQLRSTLPEAGFYQLNFQSVIIARKSWSHSCLMYAEDHKTYDFRASGPNEILYNHYRIESASFDQQKINELQGLENRLSARFRHKKSAVTLLTDHYLSLSNLTLYKAYQDSLLSLNSAAVSENRQVRRDFITHNTKTHYTSYLISRATDIFDEYALYKKTLSQLDPKLKESKSYRDALENLEAVAKLYKGAKAPEVSGYTVSGQKIRVDYSTADYTFIDFWASYCMPCRQEHPNLRKLFKQYRGKRLNIVSVSIDKNPNHWKLASKQDSISWQNIAELAPQERSKNVKNFAVKIIPSNYLINRKGKIINKNISINDLTRLIMKIYQ